MPFTLADHGVLTAAYMGADEKTIQAELTRLDPLLFLDPEVEPGRFVYWTVKQHVGSGHPPVCVLEWRDRDKPWPLTHAIVEHVRRREGAIATAYVEAAAANELKRQKTIEKVGDEAYDVALDAKKAAGKTSAVLPRSQGLRRSRDRARAAGKKV